MRTALHQLFALSLAALGSLGYSAAHAGLLQDTEALARAKNCMACHAIDAPLTGPAYQSIAAKYARNGTAATTLAVKIQKGGGGVWGSIAMPASPHVNPEEAKQLATWVLSQK